MLVVIVSGRKRWSEKNFLRLIDNKQSTYLRLKTIEKAPFFIVPFLSRIDFGNMISPKSTRSMLIGCNEKENDLPNQVFNNVRTFIIVRIGKTRRFCHELNRTNKRKKKKSTSNNSFFNHDYSPIVAMQIRTVDWLEVIFFSFFSKITKSNGIHRRKEKNRYQNSDDCWLKSFLVW